VRTPIGELTRVLQGAGRQVKGLKFPNCLTGENGGKGGGRIKDCPWAICGHGNIVLESSKKIVRNRSHEGEEKKEKREVPWELERGGGGRGVIDS